MSVIIDESAAVALLTLPGGSVVQELEAVGQRVADTARALCPVNTGRLRDSIEVLVGRTSEGGIEILVGSDVEYAIYMEIGTQYVLGFHFLEQALQQVV